MQSLRHAIHVLKYFKLIILNLSLSGVGMLFAVGYNFRSGSLNLPVNLVIMPGKSENGSYRNDSGDYIDYTYNSGTRISLMIGFNLAK